MTMVHSEWLTNYAMHVLELHIPILSALNRYWTYALRALVAYHRNPQSFPWTSVDDGVLGLLLSVDGKLLEHIPAHRQTAVLCTIAVRQNPWAFPFVHETQYTPKLCLDAVSRNGVMLFHISPPLQAQYPEICRAALCENGGALCHVYDKTPHLCLLAVQHSGWALQDVPHHTYEVCLAAITQEPMALQYVSADMQRAHPELCRLAVQANPKAIRYVHDQTLC
jgi:hypothetical protein